MHGLTPLQHHKSMTGRLKTQRQSLSPFNTVTCASTGTGSSVQSMQKI
jgi:hypothetical protein